MTIFDYCQRLLDLSAMQAVLIRMPAGRHNIQKSMALYQAVGKSENPHFGLLLVLYFQYRNES
jgi:hypothetical protein